MDIDHRGLTNLMEESCRLHADAMARAERNDHDPGRRRLLTTIGLGAGSLAARGLAYGTVGSVAAGLVATPAAADRALDVQILQTASSLEQLVVDVYNTILTTNPAGIGDLPGTAGQVVRTFVTTTLSQHEQHKRAFQEQTRLLGGPEQTLPNPKFQLIADARMSRFRTPVDVLGLGALLEKVATDTYLVNLTQLEDADTKELLAGVMGVEAQHLSSLGAIGSLLEADTPELVKIPVGPDVANLPPTFGSVAFPEPLPAVGSAELIAQPETGAVR